MVPLQNWAISPGIELVLRDGEGFSWSLSPLLFKSFGHKLRTKTVNKQVEWERYRWGRGRGILLSPFFHLDAQKIAPPSPRLRGGSVEGEPPKRGLLHETQFLLKIFTCIHRLGEGHDPSSSP